MTSDGGTRTELRGLSQPVEIRGSVATAPAEGLPRDYLPLGPPPDNIAGVPEQLPARDSTGTGQQAPANKVVGVVCSGDVAVYRDQVKSALERGKEQRPDAVWVCIEPKSDRMTHDVMLSLDIEPVVLPLNGAWRCKHDEHGYDLRRVWRDFELLLCDEVIVFHKRTGNSPWRERAESGRYAGRLFVVELGDAREKKRRKGRAPVGN